MFSNKGYVRSEPFYLKVGVSTVMGMEGREGMASMPTIPRTLC